MIERLEPYATYKESEQKWLGQVPAHWRTPRLKTVLREKDVRSLDGSGLLLSLTRNRGLIARNEITDKIHSARTLVGYKLYEPGEVVMNRMQAWSGMFGAGSKPGLVSPDYAVFKLLGDGLVSFLLARIRAPDLVSQFALESKGIGSGFNRLYSDKFGAISISLPPPDEQSAIVRFLDHANRKIDGFIRAKRKLIGLLNEQKQVIIHRAVTRGVRPDVSLKPSDTPWIGDIPKHWEVVRSRRLFTVRTELARTDDVQLSATQSHGVIPQAEYEAKIGRRVVKISMHLEKRRHVEKDDFVISMRSFQGGIERAWSSGAIRSSYVVMKPDPNVDVTFFSYVLKSPGYIRALQATGDFIRDGQDLTYGNFRMVDLPLMPLPEQKQIAAYIETETKTLKTSLARTEREIELMQEYRTRLTADLVAGKLDVRAAAATLPAPPSDAAAEPVADETLEEIETEDAEA